MLDGRGGEMAFRPAFPDLGGADIFLICFCILKISVF